jgi:hypothetical protein
MNLKLIKYKLKENENEKMWDGMANQRGLGLRE